MKDHICPDCGRHFSSGAALGGHRRVHTKGKLSKKDGAEKKQRRSAKSSTNLHATASVANSAAATQNTSRTNTPTQSNTNSTTTGSNARSFNDYNVSHPLPPNPNVDAGAYFRASPEPYLENRFYDQCVTETSSDEDGDDDDVAALDYNAQDLVAMPPPIKRRKLNMTDSQQQHPQQQHPSSIGYSFSCTAASAVQSASHLARPTQMDAVREQIGLAMTLYHFNVESLAAHCGVDRQIFTKWLQGAVDQSHALRASRDSTAANNNNNATAQAQSRNAAGAAVKPSKKIKIKFKRSKIKKENYLSASLAEQLTAKMKQWLDEFISAGFGDDKYLPLVHHYQRYKREGGVTGNTAHCFENADLKFDKIKVEDERMADELNQNACYDWNDDSSFFYRAHPQASQSSQQSQPQSGLVAIEINDELNGKPFHDSLLWDPENGLDLAEFVDCYCNDLKQHKNTAFKERVVASFTEQIARWKQTESEYAASLRRFSQQTDKRSANYFQHLQAKNDGGGADAQNLMYHISDACHGHIVIKLRITHGKIRLIDSFLWNINDPENCKTQSIEKFANVLCAEQGLPFKFAPSIAISIRQQIQQHKEDVIESLANHHPSHSNGRNGHHANVKLYPVNDPLEHESLRYVGRKSGGVDSLDNLQMWQPKILVYKPPSRQKTRIRD